MYTLRVFPAYTYVLKQEIVKCFCLSFCLGFCLCNNYKEGSKYSHLGWAPPLANLMTSLHKVQRIFLCFFLADLRPQ